MLELESNRWSELTHANGSASDIPKWLSELASGDVDLSEGWDLLCHQCSVYSATFAAAPYVLKYAETAPIDKRVETLSFLGTVHAWKQPNVIATTPSDIIEWYNHSILNAADLATKTFLNEKLDSSNAIYVLEAVASLHGCAGPGKIISGFANDEFTVECPKCNVDLYVWPDQNTRGFFAASDDPVSNSNAKRIDVKLANPPPDWDGTTFDCKNAYEWLYRLSIHAGYSEIATSLQSLYGVVICPECVHEFDLMHALENAT